MANTIGDLLIHEGLISAAQLAQALSCLKRDGAGLGDVLVSLGFLSSDQLSQFFRPVPQAPLEGCRHWPERSLPGRLASQGGLSRSRHILVAADIHHALAPVQRH